MQRAQQQLWTGKHGPRGWGTVISQVRYSLSHWKHYGQLPHLELSGDCYPELKRQNRWRLEHGWPNRKVVLFNILFQRATITSKAIFPNWYIMISCHGLSIHMTPTVLNCLKANRLDCKESQVPTSPHIYQELPKQSVGVPFLLLPKSWATCLNRRIRLLDESCGRILYALLNSILMPNYG